MTAARKMEVTALPTRPKLTAVTNEDPLLERALDKLSVNYIQCRDFGHSWRPYSARLDSEMHCYVQELRCSRCTTIRARDIGLHGQLLGNHYDYPEGYTLPPGMGRLSGDDRDGIRFRSIQRLLPTDTTED